MSTVQILKSTPGQQTASPLFGRLPAEVRLMIYKLTFISCFVTAWFDHEFFNDAATRPSRTAVQIPWHLFRRPVPAARTERFVRGKCCYSHTGWGFGFLVTCRTAYMEAFDTYWENVTLEVARDLERTGCGLVSVCAYLPGPIKDNLRHLRNVRLPILLVARSWPSDATWTPALLRQLPSLASLEFTSMVLHGQVPSSLAWDRTADLIGGPIISDLEVFMGGTGPFRVLTGLGESPAEFIQRRIGVEPSCGVTILSTEMNANPHKSRRFPNHLYDVSAGPLLSSPPDGFVPMDLSHRPRLYNWTTGMVYLTPGFDLTPRKEEVYQMLLKAPQSQEWTRATRSQQSIYY